MWLANEGAVAPGHSISGQSCVGNPFGYPISFLWASSQRSLDCLTVNTQVGTACERKLSTRTGAREAHDKFDLGNRNFGKKSSNQTREIVTGGYDILLHRPTNFIALCVTIFTSQR